MKVVLITLGSKQISGLEEAFASDLIERVEGNTPESVEEDVKQFIETWTPDLLVIAEAESNARQSSAALIIEALRKEKLLKQPAIFVGNLTDEKSIEVLKAGAQALLPVTVDGRTLNHSVNSQLLRTQAVNLTNLSKGQATKDFRLGEITVLQDSREVYIFNTKLHTTQHEGLLFTSLVLGKGRTLSKDALFSQLYAYDTDVHPKILDVFICKLRKRLKDALAPLGYDGGKIIGTDWGRGYRIDLAFVPGLDAKTRHEFILGDGRQQAAIPQLAAPAPSAFDAAAKTMSGNKTKNLPAPRVPMAERTLPKPSTAKTDILTKIKDFLKVADFKERDADIRNYVTLTRQAVEDGHTTQELFTLFARCFTPLWQRNGVIDQKTFEYHLTNPERLRFYKINQDAVAAVPVASGSEDIAGASRPLNAGTGIEQTHHRA